MSYLFPRLHADTYREHVEKVWKEEEKFLDSVYIFLLINNDNSIEFTFALEPNKVKIKEVNLFIANKERDKLF